MFDGVDLLKLIDYELSRSVRLTQRNQESCQSEALNGSAPSAESYILVINELSFAAATRLIPHHHPRRSRLHVLLAGDSQSSKRTVEAHTKTSRILLRRGTQLASGGVAELPRPTTTVTLRGSAHFTWRWQLLEPC